MHILAVEAVGQFVGMGLADHARAGREQTLDRGRGARRRRVSVEPYRIAVSGAMTGNVVHVLDGKSQTVERATRRSVQFDMGMAAERVVGIVGDHCGRCRIAGWRDTVLRPRLKAYSTGASSATAISGFDGIEHDKIGRLADGEAVILQPHHFGRPPRDHVEAFAHVGLFPDLTNIGVKVRHANLRAVADRA